MDQILGWIATSIFSFMLIPQIIKTLKSQTVEGVSLSLFIAYLIGNLFAICYAFMIWQPPLILKYSLAIITTIFYIICYFHIKRRSNSV